VLIGDKLVCVSRRNGAFVLAAKHTYELLSTNEFASDTTHFNGTPAVSGDVLILRSNKAVYCVGTK
jgi:outer membrane protein assembly factor BamB